MQEFTKKNIICFVLEKNKFPDSRNSKRNVA